MTDSVGPVVVVMPAYNESGALAEVLESVCAKNLTVVVVDDGSTDDTWIVASRFPVHRLRHPINLGQGAALQTGTSYALELGASEIVHFDSDGQHAVNDIERLLEPIQTGAADIALGSRFLKEKDRRRVPLGRMLLLRLAVMVNLAITRVRLSDAHNGFRAMSRETARRIRIRHNGPAHATEIVDEIRRHALCVVEVPTTITYTTYSQAKGQRSWSAVDTFFDLILRRIER